MNASDVEGKENYRIEKNIRGRVSGDSYATLGLAVRGSMSLVDNWIVLRGPSKTHEKVGAPTTRRVLLPPVRLQTVDMFGYNGRQSRQQSWRTT